MTAVRTAVVPGSLRARGFGTLFTTELKVWLREPTGVFFALVFPSLLLLGLGLAIPDFSQPMTDAPPPWNEAPGVTSYLPTIIALAVGTIALTTMPAWTPLFGIAAAVVTETGGALSHCAVVAREYGLPAVVGAYGATTVIATGQRITVDGERGIVMLAV